MEYFASEAKYNLASKSDSIDQIEPLHFAKVSETIKPGTILISHPLMLFETWRNSLILIIKNDLSGTEGLIINKQETENRFYGGFSVEKILSFLLNQFF